MDRRRGHLRVLAHEVIREVAVLRAVFYRDPWLDPLVGELDPIHADQDIGPVSVTTEGVCHADRLAVFGRLDVC